MKAVIDKYNWYFFPLSFSGKAGNREDDEEEMVDIDQDVRDAEDMEEDGGQDGWNTVNLEQEDDKLPGVSFL